MPLHILPGSKEDVTHCIWIWGLLLICDHWWLYIPWILAFDNYLDKNKTRVEDIKENI